MSQEAHNRNVDRKATVLPATFRTATGMRDEGFVADLSTHGCCISVKSLYLSLGTRLMVKPQGMEALSGIVRWIEGSRAGIQFDRPLYIPVADHLTSSNAAE